MLCTLCHSDVFVHISLQIYTEFPLDVLLSRTLWLGSLFWSEGGIHLLSPCPACLKKSQAFVFLATSHWDNHASRSNFAADTEVCWGFTAAEFSAQRLLSQSHLQQHECSLFERRHAGLCLFVFLFYRHSFATVVHTVQLSLKRDCTMRIVRKETAWICLGAWGIATAGGEVLNFR